MMPLTMTEQKCICSSGVHQSQGRGRLRSRRQRDAILHLCALSLAFLEAAGMV